MIKYEVRSKEFNMLPELDVSVSGKRNHLIVNWKECITVLVYKPRSSDCLVQVYSFEERCGIWSKMFNVGPVPGPVQRSSYCFMYGGEIVFDVRGDLMSNDQKTKKLKVLCNLKEYLLNCFSYQGSLVFLQGMKPLYSLQP